MSSRATVSVSSIPAAAAARALLVLLLMLGASGCREIRLISEYDEETDRATTALHKKVEALLIGIERNAGTAAADFQQYDQAYGDILSDLRVLQLRAASRPQNGLQEAQLEELRIQLELLEEAHREGITPAEIPAFRNGFDQSFRAVLTLELAKKRGDSSSN